MSFEINNPSNYNEHPEIGNSLESFPVLDTSDTANNIIMKLEELDIPYKVQYKNGNDPLYSLPSESILLDAIVLEPKKPHIIQAISGIGEGHLSILSRDNQMGGHFRIHTIHNQMNVVAFIELMYALEDGFL